MFIKALFNNKLENNSNNNDFCEKLECELSDVVRSTSSDLVLIFTSRCITFFINFCKKFFFLLIERILYHEKSEKVKEYCSMSLN